MSPDQLAATVDEAKDGSVLSIIEELSAQIDALKLERNAAQAALRDLLLMMDEGLLVRDISKDAGPDFALRMLSFVARLKRASEASLGAQS